MKKQTLTKSMLMTALICGFVQWGGTAVHAEELQEFTLDPMIVTAQRMETRDLDTPAMVDVITAADIEKTGATTVMEVLRSVPGIADYSYSASGDNQGSSSSRVMVRGFDKGTLVLLNGAPINIFNYGSPSGIPVEAIERIEVVKGANSVLYGAEALGGVVNIITKKGSDKAKTSVSGTTGNYLKKWNITTEGESYIASIGKDYVDEITPGNKANNNKEKGWNYKKNIKYQRENAFASLKLTRNLQFNWLYSEMNPGSYNINVSDGKQNGDGYEYEDTKHALSMIYENEDTKSVLAYNQTKMLGTKFKNNGTVERAGHTSNYKASNLYFDSQKEWNIDEGSTLITGVTFKHEDYNEEYRNAADNSRDSYAIYASYNKAFDDKFSATLGVRGQYYASSDFDGSYEEFMPQLQTLYKISDSLSWYTNVGKAFELPSVNAHAAYISYNLPATSVKPQTGWNYETGVKKVTDTTSTKLAVYHMDFKDKFAWKKLTELGTNDYIQVNTGKFKNTGVELEYTKILSDKWTTDFGIAYQNPESYDETSNEWIQDTAKLHLSANVNYKLQKFSANLNCLYLGDREDAYYRYADGREATNSSGLPADHSLKDRIKLNASFAYNPNENQEIRFNMYNLLDRDDFISETETYDLPFNWTLTYTHTF